MLTGSATMQSPRILHHRVVDPAPLGVNTTGGKRHVRSTMSARAPDHVPALAIAEPSQAGRRFGP
jgi:hypothetical protein